MINVLILGLHDILGGSETYVNNLIRCFPKDRIVCDFLVVGNNKTPYEDSINSFYNDGRSHFYYCPNLKRDPITGWRYLKKFYNNNAYDIIYMNATSAANIIYCQYLINKEKVPVITHSHFSNGPRINHLIYRAYTKKHSVFKLACSKPAANWMFGNEKDVIFIPNGIDTNRFAFNLNNRTLIRKQLNISDKSILIGHVGRFSPEKNHKFLVELCKCLDSKYVFLCVGDGPCKAEINELIEKYDLKERFIVLPVDTNIEKYYSAMDCFTMPSLYEGLPMVSVEAQCSGLPIIFSDTISKQADISGHAFFEKLNDLEAWKDRINSLNYERYDGEKEVKQSGFSINETESVIEEMLYKVLDRRK